MGNDLIHYGKLHSPDADILGRLETFISRVEQELDIVTALSTDHTLNAKPQMPSLFLAKQEKRIVGVATIFAAHPSTGEFALCVLPGLWRRGIGSTRLGKALEVLSQHDIKKRLLICDRKSISGTHFALRHAQNFLFSEFGMRHEAPATGIDVAGLEVRPARVSDVAQMTRICAAAFAEDEQVSGAFIGTSMISVNRTGYIGSVEGTPVAICFVTDSEESRSLNTIAVDPVWQGKGYAKKFLLQIMRLIPDDGKRLELDVNSKNEVAIALYRRLGFEIVSDIGYYEV